ncbi:MAG: transporter ATP-binding protein [Pseudonocardiales bacterium]|nr:transporter ATP-binding protein [Pseudonocardiales bacterium]
MASDLVLEANDLDVRYGVIHAVQQVTLSVRRSSVTALVGSNGAGKSSILKAISGMVPSHSGRVVVNGADISSLPTRKRLIEHGLVLVPEGRSAFTTMTVRENLDLGLRIGKLRQAAGASASFSLDEAFTLFPVLKDREKQRAQVLSGGEQQMLALARSLLMAPQILLIDEPSMGLAPLLVRRIFTVLESVFASHEVTVLLVEQDTAVALELAEDAYLLEHGRIIAHAPSDRMRDDPRLRQAYLGSADALGRSVATVQNQEGTS